MIITVFQRSKNLVNLRVCLSRIYFELFDGDVVLVSRLCRGNWINEFRCKELVILMINRLRHGGSSSACMGWRRKRGSGTIGATSRKEGLGG